MYNLKKHKETAENPAACTYDGIVALMEDIKAYRDTHMAKTSAKLSEVISSMGSAYLDVKVNVTVLTDSVMISYRDRRFFIIPYIDERTVRITLPEFMQTAHDLPIKEPEINALQRVFSALVLDPEMGNLFKWTTLEAFRKMNEINEVIAKYADYIQSFK